MADQRSTYNNPPPAFIPPSYAHPAHSPDGPQCSDLPPSYDEAQQQALQSARDGIPTLDPSQLEAHRLTLNEGPNEPEIWEYRVRGEEPNNSNEHEQAPVYERHVGGHNMNVPIQYNSNSESFPVGSTDSIRTGPTLGSDQASAILSQSLRFALQQPGVGVQYASPLMRCIAIPQEGLPAHTDEASPENNDASNTPVQFLRAHAKSLYTHDVRPAEFVEFLDGLTAVCEASQASNDDLVSESSQTRSSLSMVQNYINGANSAFFAPRGLEVSLCSLSTLLTMLNIPVERGQLAGIIASVIDEASTSIKRAESLYPWIEALDTNVPAPNTRTIALREMAQRWRSQGHAHAGPSHTVARSTVESSSSDPGPTNAQYNRDPPFYGSEQLQRNSEADIDDKKSHEYGKKGKSKVPDDASSIYSDSSDSWDSDSDSDSDSDDDDYLDPQATFLARVHSINARAESLAAKGKKTPEETAQERELAIEKAQNKKLEMEFKIEEKMSKRALRKEWKQKGRDQKKQHRLRRREMKNTYEGKEKEKVKKTKQWKEEKKAYKEMRKEFYKDKKNARREWKEAKESRRAAKAGQVFFGTRQEEVMRKMVWMVVENLRH